MRRHALAIAALVVGAAIPIAAGGAVACASEADRAALVVDTGEDAYTYCVMLSDDSVSGLELIQLANEQHGLQYRFGDGGQAVCMLANVGAEGDDCFGKYPDFWGYWRGNGSGDWEWSSVGAGSTVVSDGDVEGWSWGRGQDGSTHPPPPATEFDDVCTPQAPPREEANDSRSSDARASTNDSASADQRVANVGAPQDDSASEERIVRRRTRERSTESDVAPRRAPRTIGTESDDMPGVATDAAASGTEPAPSQGPPTTGLVALALVGLLGAGGAVAMKRKRT